LITIGKAADCRPTSGTESGTKRRCTNQGAANRPASSTQSGTTQRPVGLPITAG
jgi:hypothetical protein